MVSNTKRQFNSFASSGDCPVLGGIPTGVAFTIAMTYGVTDTALKSRAVRVTALQQALLSYLFGTVILALTVQVIGSLNSL